MRYSLRNLAETISPSEVARVEGELRSETAWGGDARARDVALLLACAYPALFHAAIGRPEDLVAVARGSLRRRDARALLRGALGSVGDLGEGDGVRSGLRRFAFREKLRIALRELLPELSADVEVTAGELSDLADVCIDVALREARAWAERRFGEPVLADGRACPLTVLGMGKLGGRELNAGSDVDLLFFYESDDGVVMRDGAPSDVSLHEYFTRVTQRTIANIEEATADGIVWRVDMRLRPEGTRGPLVNSLPAAERYYETWGRTWERAALLRARPCAGDLSFGREVLSALAPFVWRKPIDPRVADEMVVLLVRARATAAPDDLKLGLGGIRAAEFFVQSLQLVWGGRDASLRAPGTLDALRRLRAAGLVTEREARLVADGYVLLRRVEHRVQFATGLQTHALPHDTELRERIARSLGFGGEVDLDAALAATRREVAACLDSVTTTGGKVEAAEVVDPLLAAIGLREEAAVLAALPGHFGERAAPDLARHMLALARRPDAPLGEQTFEQHPGFGVRLIEALADAADPEQATRLMAAFFGRFLTPSTYVRALAEDDRALRRLAGLFGASALLGSAAVAHPELVDQLLFGRGVPDPERARRAVDEEVAALAEPEDTDALVGALRRAKGRVTMEVGLADLAGEIDTSSATRTLTALAEAVLEHATRRALGEKGLARGLAVIGMGKLGGREIGYGSDLDLFFVYDAAAAGLDEGEAEERFIRIAQRVLRLLGAPHGDGPGYELDTRLRPSGNQGLLVVSLDGFARYHAASSGGAADWERQALVKARFCAGDAELGRRVVAVAKEAAYERGAAPPDRLHHLRMRMQRELSGERLGDGRRRFDPKLGRGGIVDVEFVTQWLQMKHGHDPRVRTTETDTALVALEACGYLDPQTASTLRDGFRTLRQLEQRLRIHHAVAGAYLEEGSPRTEVLARRLGVRATPRESPGEALLRHYVSVTLEVRAAYLAVLGLPPDAADEALADRPAAKG